MIYYGELEGVTLFPSELKIGSGPEFALLTYGVETLTDNTLETAIGGNASFVHADYGGAHVEFVIERVVGARTERRVGEFKCMHDGTDAFFIREEGNSDGSPFNILGITIDVRLQGLNFEITYTSTSTGEDATIYLTNKLMT